MMIVAINNDDLGAFVANYRDLHVGPIVVLVGC